MAYIFAVDGGGTKTHAIIFDTVSGAAILGEFGATNHELIQGGFHEMRRRLMVMTAEVERQSGIKAAEIAHSVWGMAGMDTVSQHGMISGFIRELGFGAFTLCNDAYLVIKAGSSRGYGVCLLAGTGPNTAGLNHEERMFQIGSQFDLTGDFGGGMMLGTAAVRTVYLNLFRYHKDTILNRLLFNFYGINSKYDLMDKVMDNSSSGEIPIPRLAKLVFDAANQSDEQAVELLRLMGRTYALQTKSLLEELDFPDEELEITLAGSLFTQGWSSVHINELRGELAANLSVPFVLRSLEEPPITGALMWALKKIGGANAAQTAREVVSRLLPKA